MSELESYLKFTEKYHNDELVEFNRLLKQKNDKLYIFTYGAAYLGQRYIGESEIVDFIDKLIRGTGYSYEYGYDEYFINYFIDNPNPSIPGRKLLVPLNSFEDLEIHLNIFRNNWKNYPNKEERHNINNITNLIRNYRKGMIDKFFPPEYFIELLCKKNIELENKIYDQGLDHKIEESILYTRVDKLENKLDELINCSIEGIKLKKLEREINNDKNIEFINKVEEIQNNHIKVINDNDKYANNRLDRLINRLNDQNDQIKIMQNDINKINKMNNILMCLEFLFLSTFFSWYVYTN